MPLVDPQKKAARVAKRHERRAKILALIHHLLEELDDLSDDVYDEIKKFLDAPGAPSNPDFKGPGGR